MRTAFRYFAVLNDKDLISVADGGEAVCDRDDRAAAGDPGDCLLDLAFCFNVYRRCCFIQDNNRRTAQDSARDSDSLFLATAKAQSAFANLSVVAVRHRHDILMNIGSLRGFLNLCHRSVRRSVADVLGDRAVEEERILQHRRDLASEALDRDVVDIMAVDQNAAFIRLVEARDQLCHGGLADAGGTDERQHFAGSAVERDVLQYRDAFVIGKTDMVKSDLALDILKIFGTRTVRNLNRRIQDLHDTFRAGKGLLHILQKVGKAGNRRIEEAQIQKKRDDGFDLQAFGIGQIAADSHHENRSDRRSEFHKRMENRADLQGIEHRVYMLKVAFIDSAGLVFLPAEGLDLMNAGEIVLQLAVQLAHLLLLDSEEGTNLFGEEKAGDDDQRDGGAGDQRELPVDRQQDDQRSREGNEVGDGFRNHVGVEQLKIPGVIDDSAHQITGLLVVEEAKMHTLDLVVGLGAEIAHQVPGGFMGQVVAQEPEQDPE